MPPALSFLEHRTRQQAMTPSLAPAGRYLSFADENGPQLIALGERLTHIGRGLTADIRVDDHRVARLHAIIVQHPEGARLLDGRSADGTLVNGEPVLAADLNSGDEITLGPITMRYVELPVESRLTRTARERRAQARLGVGVLHAHTVGRRRGGSRAVARGSTDGRETRQSAR
jgi:pSer/pThr/pTyr-binding forkhead associated (FHA) protein